MSDVSPWDEVDDPSEPPRAPRKYRGPNVGERLGDTFQGDPIGPRQTLAVSNAAVMLAPPAYARSATVTIDTASVRYTADGTVPTATVGTLVAAGATIVVTGLASLRGLQLIRATGVDATAQVEYFN